LVEFSIDHVHSKSFHTGWLLDSMTKKIPSQST